MMNPLKNNFICNKNPMQAVVGMSNEDMLLNMLKQQNPQGYETLMTLMKSGQNPSTILQQMMGNISPQQKAQIEQFAKQFNLR